MRQGFISGGARIASIGSLFFSDLTKLAVLPRKGTGRYKLERQTVAINSTELILQLGPDLIFDSLRAGDHSTSHRSARLEKV